MTDTSPRVGTPRHGALARRNPVARTARVIAIVLAVAVASVAGVAAIGVWQVTRQFGDNAVDISNGSAIPSIGAIDGAFNVLLVGADNAPGQKSWGESRDATLNDVNILVHVSADHQHATVLSFPRDLEIPHPACEDPVTHETFAPMSQQPLNTAFARGGLGCVVATIHALTGIDIPYAALFTFEGTVKMADAVGGVPICVTKAIDDPDSGLKLPKGRSVVTGRTALAYLRDRHGVGDGSDLARIASQQAYMSSLMRVMTSSDTLSNPGKLYGLAEAAAKSITLSQSLASPDTMVTMALALKGMRPADMTFVQYPAGEDPENANKLVPSSDLDAQVVDRILNDKTIGLDKDSLGYNRTAAKSTATASTHKKHKKKSKNVIAGVLGQTAAQQTCSVAADS